MGHHHSKSSNDDNSPPSTCTASILDQVPTDPITGSMSFHQVAVIISGVCAIISTGSILFLMTRHAANMSRPKEQLEILRICFVIPAYAIGAFVLILVPTVVYSYLASWLEVAMAFALVNFSILVCRLCAEQAASSTNTKGFSSFHSLLTAPLLAQLSHPGKKPVTQEAAVKGFRRRWYLIAQLPIVSMLSAIFAMITQGAGVYCESSGDKHFAYFWLHLIMNLSKIVGTLSVVAVAMATKQAVRPGSRSLLKLVAFKALVFLSFLQNVVYMVLKWINPTPLHPTKTLSNADLQITIPMLLIALEVVFFAIVFHPAYSVTPYAKGQHAMQPLAQQHAHSPHDHASERLQYDEGGLPVENNSNPHEQPMGFLTALVRIFDPREVLAVVSFCFNIQAEIDNALMKRQAHWPNAHGPENTAYQSAYHNAPPAYQ